MSEWIAANTSLPVRVFAIVVLVAAAHLIVIAVRGFSDRLMAARPPYEMRKLKSVTSLATSAVVFVIYFAAIGLILYDLNVGVETYFGSAAVIGLAVGFGSQGLVQDVVTGLTLIFSDLFDVGEMVEISGQSGVVRSIGLRFIVLENALGAEIFIPNRTITNVINYPRGYVRCLVDVSLPQDAQKAEDIERIVMQLFPSVTERFPGILVAPPSVEERVRTSAGREFIRIKFRLWPGRGAPIETTFRQELLEAIKTVDPDYAEWMVAVHYEVEKQIRRPQALWFRKRTR
ncbi:MAG: mechanosensitive ion channel family protein [Gammaproteobacteria bacterium]